MPFRPAHRRARAARLLSALLLIGGFPGIAIAQAPAPAARGALARGSWAIVGVDVIPMTSDTVLRGMTVLVRDGRIGTIGRAGEVTLPAGARRIEGRGRYLMPGLADMHTHLYSDGAVPDSAGPAELGVLLAHGITAARLMIGTPEHLVLRAAVAAGSVAGPQLWVASPHFTTDGSDNARVVRTPADVRRAVREVKASGYDFVKVTFGITDSLYDALVDEARRREIRVVGHVEPAVGVPRAIAAGQQIEHLDAYFEAALADSAPVHESVTQFRVYRPENWASLDHIDDAKLTAIAAATARAGIWTVPTLEIFNRAFGIPLGDAELHALPDWTMIPAALRPPYERSRARYWGQPVRREQRARFAEIRSSLVRRIAEAGGAARIMAGSDSPDLLMAYGWAMHRELQHLVRAGLTPWQALAAATRNPAEFLGAAREWGTVEVGRRADLLLLEGNPLEDITNTGRIAGVSAGGSWLGRAELDAMVARGRTAIGGGEPAEPPASAGFEVRTLAPGVHAAIRREPPGLYRQPNTVFIVRDSGVVVVDAHFTREASAEVLLAIRQVTDRPVTDVVFTHWHDDHVTGADVYREAFPRARFVAHRAAAAGLVGDGRRNRDAMTEALPGTIGYLRSLLESGRSLDGSALADDERAAYARDTVLMAAYLAELPRRRVQLPAVLVDERMTLPGGGPVVELLYLGRGHTDADLVVHLPEQGIVVAGDLVVSPVPLVGSTSYPAEYAATLDRLRALGASVIVPGHGDILDGGDYLRRLADLLRAIASRTTRAAQGGATLEQVRRAVDLSDQRRLFAGDSRLLGVLFDNYVTMPAVARAYEAAARGR